jgi:hypothetical protein
MQEFYREVDDNININQTFSINDIGDEDRLHRFYVIGEEIVIDNILEDSEFLLENTEKVIDKLDAVLNNTENITISIDEDPEVDANKDNNTDDNNL